MYDLAYEIAEAIKQIANTGTHSDSANTKAPVYLAESSSDLSEQRESVKAELRQLGYTILPDKPLPIESDHLRKAVQADFGSMLAINSYDWSKSQLYSRRGSTFDCTVAK